jgi:hypothetical protein
VTDLRIVEKWLVDDLVRIYAAYRGRVAPMEYAVMLQVRIEGRMRTIRLFDNAHGSNEMHEYTGAEKQPAEPFLADQPPNEAMPATIEYLENNWEEVLYSWKR